MPIYEYLCESCRRKFTALIGMTTEPDDEHCPHCKSKQTTRLVSKPAKFRKEDDRLDELADKLERMQEPTSYRQMRDTVRELGSALDDSAADDMEEMFELDAED